jgi:hypothetical protein
MPTNNRFGIVELKQYRFGICEGASYTEFDHGDLGKQIHVFFEKGDSEFRFTIDSKVQVDIPAEIVQELYEINAPLSLPDWCVAPYVLTNTLTEGWACAYGLMEGEGVRIHKAVFENGDERITWTFSCAVSLFESGFELYEKFLRSFTIIVKG